MKLLKRFIIAILFSLLVTTATFIVVQGQTETSTPDPQQTQKPNACLGCHPKFTAAWQSGAMGHAKSDPIFNEMWTDQGKPGACLVCHVTGYDPASGTWEEDGVACDNCHGPVPAAHLSSPSSNPVPVDRTSDLCGRCHTGERFNVQAWQSSTHFQRAMTCTVCHDPHSSALKTVQGQEEKGPSALCINCHSEVSMAFPYSKHNQSGVSCVDCHLRHFEPGSNNDVHALPDHSFTASIATCSACHASQMHAQPTETVIAASTATIEITSTPIPNAVVSKPSQLSPLGIAGLAGVIGLTGGMVLQPWLEKAYRKMKKKDIKK